MQQQIICTMTTCKYNDDRECVKGSIYIDENWNDKRRPVCTDYQKREDDLSD